MMVRFPVEHIRDVFVSKTGFGAVFWCEEYQYIVEKHSGSWRLYRYKNHGDTLRHLGNKLTDQVVIALTLKGYFK